MMEAPSVDAVRGYVLRAGRGAGLATIERVRDGVSTYVYRLRYSDRTEYLRVWPLRDESLASESLAYRRLRAYGVSVPDLCFFSAEERIDGLSALITSELPGVPLAAIASPAVARRIAWEAGQQLARMHTVPVDGYGWIRRAGESVERLEGEHADYRAFWNEHLDGDLRSLAQLPAMRPIGASIERLAATYAVWLEGMRDQAVFAHGDFDVSAIRASEGLCSAIIDLSEMRGADRWYDLGHFYLHGGEPYPVRLNDALQPILLSGALLAGYGSISPLPPDALPRVAFVALLIGLRTYVRAASKGNGRLRDWMALRMADLCSQLER